MPLHTLPTTNALEVMRSPLVIEEIALDHARAPPEQSRWNG